MVKLALKIILLALAAYGSYNLVVKFQPQLPQVLQVRSVGDAVNLLSPQVTQPDEIAKTITKIISEKVGTAAHDQVCKEVMAKVIDQCGKPN